MQMPDDRQTKSPDKYMTVIVINYAGEKVSEAELVRILRFATEEVQRKARHKKK